MAAIDFDIPRDEIGSGAFAVVLSTEEKRIAYKVFKNQIWDRGQSDRRRREIFASEVEAYEIAMDNPELRPYIAEFLGKSSVCVRDGPQDLSHKFLLDCCYAMELLLGLEDTGHRTKFNGYLSLPHIQRMRDKFVGAGICYLEDASLFRPHDPLGVKIIDFRLKEVCGGP